MGALAIGTVIYCATAIVLVGAVPWKQVDQKNPLVAAFAPLHKPFVDAMITIGVLAGTTQRRAHLAARPEPHLLRDGARQDAAAGRGRRSTRASRRRRGRRSSTGIAVALLAFIVPLNVLLDLVNIGTFIAFIVVCAGVICLRMRKPDLPRRSACRSSRSFRSAGSPCSVFLSTVGLGPYTWLRFGVWLVVGLGIYFAYGFRKSELALTETP